MRLSPSGDAREERRAAEALKKLYLELLLPCRWGLEAPQLK
jgi:hypothetical protein